jgi:hypothetical protein
MEAKRRWAVKHETITLYRWADNCDHSEPDDESEASQAWIDWHADHPYGDEDERICMLTPLPTGRCEACSDAAGEDVPCQVKTPS